MFEEAGRTFKALENVVRNSWINIQIECDVELLSEVEPLGKP